MESSTLFDDHNDLLLLFYKICTPICLILNGLAVYLIIFKSSSEMKTYRWHLLHYQIWASAIDIFINFFYQPVQFYSLMAVAGHGFLITTLEISTPTCHCLYGILLCGLAVSIVELFLYRHQCIVKNKLTKKQFYFCILSQFSIFSVSTIILHGFSYSNPSNWKERLEKWDPRAVDLLKIPNVYYMSFSQSLWLFNVLRFIAVVSTGLITLALAWHIHYVMRKQSKHLSIDTRNLQRKFLVSLIWQVTVPFVFLLFPFVFICIRTFDGRLGLQILNNIASMMVSSYGIIATLCLLYFNGPYREFLIGRLKRKAEMKNAPKKSQKQYPGKDGTVLP